MSSYYTASIDLNNIFARLKSIYEITTGYCI